MKNRKASPVFFSTVVLIGLLSACTERPLPVPRRNSDLSFPEDAAQDDALNGREGDLSTIPPDGGQSDLFSIPDADQSDSPAAEDGGQPSSDGGSNAVAVFEFDLTGLQDITKISYELVSGTEMVSSEAIPSGPRFSVNNPLLLGKSWHTNIIVWLQGDKFQKVYRYRGDLNFIGTPIELPAPPSEPWVPLIHTENMGVHIFRSFDPRIAFTVEIQLPQGLSAYGLFGRTYYNEAGDQVADEIFIDKDFISTGSTMVVLPDQPIPSDLFFADSFAFATDLDSGRLLFSDYFLWEVHDGVVIPGGGQ
jgi:hypothetical protein